MLILKFLLIFRTNNHNVHASGMLRDVVLYSYASLRKANEFECGENNFLELS